MRIWRQILKIRKNGEVAIFSSEVNVWGKKNMPPLNVHRAEEGAGKVAILWARTRPYSTTHRPSVCGTSFSDRRNSSGCLTKRWAFDALPWKQRWLAWKLWRSASPKQAPIRAQVSQVSWLGALFWCDSKPQVFHPTWSAWRWSPKAGLASFHSLFPLPLRWFLHWSAH